MSYPKISIIIPVFNVEDYLADCLESIRKQSFDNIEIICINDGSTDKSMEILTMAAAVDRRIRIINKPNGGASSARNVGIKAARGDYIMFVDSDDSISSDACERILSAFYQSKAKIVVFGAVTNPRNGGDEWLEKAISPRNAVYDELHPDIIFKEASLPFIWKTAFSNSFLMDNDLSFDQSIQLGEDLVFLLSAYPQADRIVFISDKLYRYRVEREGSIMASFKRSDLDRLYRHIIIVEKVLAIWKNANWFNTDPAVIVDFIIQFLFESISLQCLDVQSNLLLDLRILFEKYFDGIDPVGSKDVNIITRLFYKQVLRTPLDGAGKPIQTWMVRLWYRLNRRLGEGITLNSLIFAPFRISMRAIQKRAASHKNDLNITTNDQADDYPTFALHCLTREFENRNSDGTLHNVRIELA